MNIIEIFGHLGADPETRFTPNGLKVTNLRVATSVRRGGKDETIWFRVTIWGDRFDKMISFLKKGSAVIVVGELSKAEVYTDKEGKAQVSLDVTAEFIRFSPFGGKGEKSEGGASKSEQNDVASQYGQPRGAQEVASGSRPAFNSADLDDGLPF